MAISTGYPFLRRTLAQRLNYWGGDVQSNGPGTPTAIGSSNTLIDTTRTELDDEWDESWIVINPGSSDQTNAPTVWRRIAPEGGWISATGTLTINGIWPSPYNVVGPGYVTGTSTAVNATTMTDNTATWTTNQWKGHTVSMGSSTGIVLSNTATILTLTSTGWTGGTPSPDGYTIAVSYELYKVFRPEVWLQAINWSLANAYPHRHLPVNFEVPMDISTRVIQWGNLVNSLSLNNPITAPVVTEMADGKGNYQPGQYTFGYTLFNDLGETLVSPIASLTVTGTNSRVRFAAFTNLPSQCLGINFYSSVYAGDTTLGQLQIGSGIMDTNVNTNYSLGLAKAGTVQAVTFPDPESGYGTFSPIYNTTNVDVQELHHILKRMNPGNYPEIWNDLGSDLYKPLGGKTIMLMFYPIAAHSLKFVCSAVVPLMSKELDVTDEPPEMIYSGGEAYLWNLLQKTSTIVNVNWRDLAKAAQDQYENLKADYALDVPRTILYKPIIRTAY